jgi:hypothetical protein
MDHVVNEAIEIQLYPDNFNKRYRTPYKLFMVSGHDHNKLDEST